MLVSRYELLVAGSDGRDERDPVLFVNVELQGCRPQKVNQSGVTDCRREEGPVTNCLERKEAPGTCRKQNIKGEILLRTQEGSMNLVEGRQAFKRRQGLTRSHVRTSRFPRKAYIIRVPFLLLFCFNKDTPKQKG